MKDFKDKLKKVPTNPGIYLMKDVNGNIIYVGKAKNLTKRVRQYFQKSRKHPPKIEEMKVVLNDFDYIVTDTELEALILENKLIKKYKPRYNAMLKNFENYKYIKITDEKFPRIIMEMNLDTDGRYYGPFSKTHFITEALEFIKDIFPIRRCNKNLNNDKNKPCLNYYIKKCIGPCSGNITVKEYNEIVNEVILLLDGKNEELIKITEKKMIDASKNMQFEKAALYRDKNSMIKHMVIKQRAITHATIDSDIIAFLTDENSINYLFYIRNGKVLGKFHLKSLSKNNHGFNKEIKEFMNKYYAGLREAAISVDGVAKEDVDEAHIIDRWLLNENGIYIRIEHIDSIEKTIDLTVERIIVILEQMMLDDSTLKLT